MSNLDPTTQMLLLLLACSAVVLFVLVIIYIVLKVKEKKTFDKNDETIESDKKSTEKHTTQALGKKSIFDFMEFDKIEDNMIIQRNGRKYIMAVECQGVNYDLMSGVEKTGVEEGFVQFLNTLRFPIQIYVQTRTVNLESSLNAYKKRVSQIEANLYKMNQQYEEMADSERYTKEQLNKAFYEITKQRNLYEYGKDIIYDTEKMSLNKNILNKKYFIIISYSPNEIGENEYDKSEIQSMAFSELYTRSQSLMRTISACGVNGKILNSVELAELLYVAYNRDESETFDLKKAAKADYDSLYSTAPDVLQKRIKELDKEIERKALDKVTEDVEKYRSKYREQVEEKESSIDELANEMAKLILDENREYLGNEMVDELLKEQNTEEGGNDKDEKKAKKTRTRKTTKSE